MTIRSFALASAFNPTLLSLLLLLSATICHGKQNQQTINSCGDIHDITFPFHLEAGPWQYLYSDYFTLSCDQNNRTVLNFLSSKYYVLSINYTSFSIRLVDRGIQTNYNICSSYPLSSLTSRDFFVGGRAYYTASLPFVSTVVFLSCGSPTNFRSPYINRTESCITNGDYSYLVAGNFSLWEVPDSCILDRMAWSDSMSDKSLLNLSLLDVNRELAYGFEAWWNNNLTCKACKELYYRHIFGYSVYYKNDPVLYDEYNNIDPNACGTCELSSSWILFLEIQSFITTFGMYFLTRIGVILGGPKLLCAPFLFGLLVIRFSRRHLSTFDGIEAFLQSENHLVPIRYSYSDIKKMTNGFRDKLGEGGFGSVYKGKLRSGPFVAIKMLSKPKADGQEFINEVATIGRIHHVNVVQLIGYCAERSTRALVYDFMPNGSLEKYIFSSEGEILSLSGKQIYEISLGVARGIGYLHHGCDMQILHFDIKPHNILLDKNFTPKISDFGLAKLYPTDDSIVTVTAARGTLGYMAPELFYKNIGGVSYKADIYSFGMLLMEMAGRRKNWNESFDSSQIFFPSWVYDQFVEGKNVHIEETTEEESEMEKKMMLVSLWCIQMRPTDRPNSMNKVIEMLKGDIQLIHLPPKPFQYSQLAMQDENIINGRSANLSGACMDSLTLDISGR